MKNLTFYITFFHLIFNVNCQYVPIGRSMHTATFVGTKIFFLGGTISRANIDKTMISLNDFFYLDISKSFDKKKEPLPFVDLSDKALEISPHYGAATSVFGKDSIFFFGGDMGELNDQSELTYSYNTTQSQWRTVAVSQSNTVPKRKRIMEAVTGNDDKIYIFGGGNIEASNLNEYYGNGMDIFDYVDKIWTSVKTDLIGRDGHTATFVPDTGEIIYIGGFILTGLMDITNLDVYNTTSGTWDKWTTKNPPEKRYGHTAVLTSDMRIIIFGGAQVGIEIPVKNRYVVLDIKKLEWYHGTETEPTSPRVPFRHHTATLYNDYMFIAFGYVFSEQPNSDDVFIYKIGDYANFTEVNSFKIDENDENAVKSIEPKINHPSNNNGVIIGASISSIIIILGFIVFVTYKWYKKPRRIRTSKLPHAQDYF